MNSLSFWEQNSFFENVDVAIVGAGIVGLSAALALYKKHKKLKIIVLEKGFITLGASTRNAGFACFGSPGELLDDLKNHSEETVFSLVEKRWNGLKLLRKNLGDNAIDFCNLGGYEVFNSKNEFMECLEKLDYLNKYIGPLTNIKKVFKNASGEVKKFGFKGVAGMVLNSGEGQLDSGKMMQALAAKAQQCGIIIVHGFEVTQFEDMGNEVKIISKTGISFRTRRLLICNNGFANKLLPDMPVIPARAQVLVTRPLKKLKLKGTFHFDKGYYYFRNIGNRILIGGGRNLDFKTEETDREGLTDIIQDHLEQLLHTMVIPYAKTEVDMRWSGIMGLGPEKTTIIKELTNNVFCAVRMGGMGIAIGSLVGEEAANLVFEGM